ncbi:microfibril-associated glycoprotein 4-like [Anopheles marshallii]|uniref:microfibril-associated glycoprotein 4-like n=1 Tax=Anopheles marshallii TaxID=1521116 RepID=UPI00237ACCA1|nr:microfibril-associated glycoprotein 4-like [Anopheles marshallii]
MESWYIVVLSVIIGAAANQDTPNNTSLTLEEVTTTTESRILEKIEHLSQTVKDEMKMFNDRIDEMKRDINRLLLAQNETNEMFGTTNKSLEKMSEQLHNFSTSATLRFVNLEQKLKVLPEDTGVYFMKPDPSKNVSFEVPRDWTNNHGFGGNWIVFQRRFNGSVDFYRNWTEYKQGFGDLRGEHWLGLDKLHAIVKTRQHELLIVLEDFDGVFAYAHYDDFKIGDESEKYVIKSVGLYSGTAGDSFTSHQYEVFSTYDQDNDKAATSHCAKSFVGAWWFYKCHRSHLNGEYLNGKINRQVGIMWYEFRGSHYSLKSTKMMVRPVA